jgi:hypothetical protein
VAPYAIVDESVIKACGGSQVDSQSVSLNPDETATTTLEWATQDGDAGSGALTVASENDTATRSVTVNAADTNDPPVASDDSYTTPEAETLFVSTPGIVDNDTDPDSDTLTVTVIDTPSNGGLDLSSDGSFEYTPEAGFTGEDSSTYEASDGNGGTDTATVTIDVTESQPTPPTLTVAITDTNAFITEGDTLSVTARIENTGGTAGTQDVSLQTFEGTQIATRTVSLDAGNTTTLSLEWPTNEGDAGSGTLTVASENDTATRPVMIQSDNDNPDPDPDPVDSNDAPSASADSYTVTENAQLVVSADDGLTANDEDTNHASTALSVSVVSEPSNGSLLLAANGSFTYTPASDFTGTDSFSYEVSDGDGATDRATVTLVVQRADEIERTIFENASKIRQTIDLPAPSHPQLPKRSQFPPVSPSQLRCP